MDTKAILALENGSIYNGVSCGIEGERVGWVSFYTGVVGYQEVATIPSNAGKIMVLTYPLIGNYGVAQKFSESDKCWIEGLIIKEKTRITSNWQAEKDFVDFLKDEKILAIEGIDTRTLMVELRSSAEQWGIISTRDFNPQSLKTKIKQAKKEELDYIKKISAERITNFSDKGPAIAIIDIGVTNSLINQLTRIGCRINLIPYRTSVDRILAISPKDKITTVAPKGLIVSDGPENDKGIKAVVETVKRLLGRLPILGIGTGCQVLALALGANIKRMDLGHRGVNYPIMKSDSLKGEITVQNHGYVIDEATLDGRGIEITWRNINDKTIEGIQNKRLKAFGYQFYPASPGFNEVNPVLEEFITSIT